ncbi:hypothetical protein DFR56_101317 [Pseudogracilibacillus auburnensis]|uniref:Uncharacterized protein n=1 Tax=Pseudogracilibacillus auburnensis TaxID=1494959 RepID=A0A2V3WDX1_9BACI|nr:hypothetical protein DFR56_101317 [Pseudogracilibacillus auburnensis]
MALRKAPRITSYTLPSRKGTSDGAAEHFFHFSDEKGYERRRCGTLLSLFRRERVRATALRNTSFTFPTRKGTSDGAAEHFFHFSDEKGYEGWRCVSLLSLFRRERVRGKEPRNTSFTFPTRKGTRDGAAEHFFHCSDEKGYEGWRCVSLLSLFRREKVRGMALRVTSFTFPTRKGTSDGAAEHFSNVFEVKWHEESLARGFLVRLHEKEKNLCARFPYKKTFSFLTMNVTLDFGG